MKPSTTPLRRSSLARSRTPIAVKSPKRAELYAGDDGRAVFVAVTLAARPRCEVDTPDCTGWADDVHETITRARNGAIVPGPLAEAQGQRFFTIARSCHTYVHTHRRWAEMRGFLDARHGWEIPTSRRDQ